MTSPVTPSSLRESAVRLFHCENSSVWSSPFAEDQRAKIGDWLALPAASFDALLAEREAMPSQEERAWSGAIPSVPGHYLHIDGHLFELFDKYPSVATPPTQAASQYEIVMTADGPVAVSFHSGMRKQFPVATCFGPRGVWLGPLPDPRAAYAQSLAGQAGRGVP